MNVFTANTYEMAVVRFELNFYSKFTVSSGLQKPVSKSKTLAGLRTRGCVDAVVASRSQRHRTH